MAKMFYPKMFISIHASSPYPANTEYKISIGEWFWEGRNYLVVKV